jgi:hypothetical protein
MNKGISARPCLCILLGGVALAATSPAHAEDGKPIEVMVFGTVHMANPGADRHNVQVDDVLSPRRQAELETMTAALARFRPTKVVVERQADGPSFELPTYRSFTPKALTEQRSEDVQIGFRLAAKLGHDKVYGFDERPGPGEPDYFPIGRVQAFAAANGKAEWLKAVSAPVRALMGRFVAEQPKRTIASLAAETNDPALIDRLHHSTNTELLKLGDGDAQPGADLNAMWYLRNAKMFGKLTNIAQPGDRVLVVVGAGHVYWLRHFASNTPGYRLAEPRPFLASAK